MTIQSSRGFVLYMLSSKWALGQQRSAVQTMPQPNRHCRHASALSSDYVGLVKLCAGSKAHDHGRHAYQESYHVQQTPGADQPHKSRCATLTIPFCRQSSHSHAARAPTAIPPAPIACRASQRTAATEGLGAAAAAAIIARIVRCTDSSNAPAADTARAASPTCPQRGSPTAFKRRHAGGFQLPRRRSRQ